MIIIVIRYICNKHRRD